MVHNRNKCFFNFSPSIVYIFNCNVHITKLSKLLFLTCYLKYKSCATSSSINFLLFVGFNSYWWEKSSHQPYMILWIKKKGFKWRFQKHQRKHTHFVKERNPYCGGRNTKGFYTKVHQINQLLCHVHSTAMHFLRLYFALGT